jgi:hypothetical protein
MTAARNVAVLEKSVVVLRPATKPKDTRLKLLVGASLPANLEVQPSALDTLQGVYGGRLSIIRATDGRICIVLPCPRARSLEVVGRRADTLMRNIVSKLNVQPIMMQCGYNTVCERLDMPNIRPHSATPQ